MYTGSTTTTIVLQPLYRSTCVSQHLQLRTEEDFVSAKFHCPHALANGNQHVLIRQKILEFSSTLSPYHTTDTLKPQEIILSVTIKIITTKTTLSDRFHSKRLNLQVSLTGLCSCSVYGSTPRSNSDPCLSTNLQHGCCKGVIAEQSKRLYKQP